MSFQKIVNTMVNENLNSNLLYEIQENWMWIITPYVKYLQKKMNMQVSIMHTYEPHALSESSIQENKFCLFIRATPESALYFYTISSDIVKIINIFFNKNIIYNIQCKTNNY